MAIGTSVVSPQAHVPMVKDETNTIAPAANAAGAGYVQADQATIVALVNDLRRIILNLNLAK